VAAPGRAEHRATMKEHELPTAASDTWSINHERRKHTRVATGEEALVSQHFLRDSRSVGYRFRRFCSLTRTDSYAVSDEQAPAGLAAILTVTAQVSTPQLWRL
jgi:hypothetical protein